MSSLLFGYRSPGGTTNINGVLDALQTEGMVSVLAQPNLTAASGQTASFLAGGEFPVPVSRAAADRTAASASSGRSSASRWTSPRPCSTRAG